MQILTIENVSKTINGSFILENISFGVESGEILALLGPCGAGKTTLLKLIAGLSMPDNGEIYIGGINLHRDFEKCMSITGFVPDRTAFDPELTGYCYLRSVAAARGGISKERIYEISSRLGLDELLDRKCGQLSHGETKRLAIACAVLHSPRLLLMDEATDGLDPIEFLDVRRFLVELTREEGISVLMTSQQMGDVERTCRRVAVLEGGVLVGVSTVDRLRKFGTGKICQRMLVDRPADAARHIAEALDIYVEVRNGYVVFDCDQSMVPKITAMLYAAGYLVYEARPHEISLEEAYYRLLRNRPQPTEDYSSMEGAYYD